MAALTPEDLFQLHPKIRMGAMVDEKGEVYFLKMRPGVKSLAPEEENRAFLQINPLVVFGACERLSQWGGAVTSVTVRYEKVLMYLARLKGRFLMLTVEKDEALETIPEIARSIESLIRKLAD